jgi:hypothetical protein
MQLYRYFVSQCSGFCCHNPLCCFSTNVCCCCCCCLFRHRLSPETFGYTLVHRKELFLSSESLTTLLHIPTKIPADPDGRGFYVSRTGIVRKYPYRCIDVTPYRQFIIIVAWWQRPFDALAAHASSLTACLNKESASTVTDQDTNGALPQSGK